MTEALAPLPIEQALPDAASRVDAILAALLPVPPGAEARLFEAMRYATLNGGKRFRPFLVLASAALFDVPADRALRVAAAVEMVHSYSLIHDDLPAMDDDALRRGQPSCHIRFDEATAILAGDALLTLAFEVLSEPATHPDPEIRCELVRGLARSVGGAGMVGGQMIDLLSENSAAGLDAIARMEGMKTGALIGFCCRSGAILAGAPEAARTALAHYADTVGLAFQIADDLLDAEGDASDIGKAAQKDAEAGKATFVSVLGVNGARRRAEELSLRAADQVKIFGERAELLHQAARFVVKRRS